MWTRLTTLLTALIVLTVAPSAMAAGGSGSCAKYDFSPFYHDGTLKWTGLARVLRHGASLHADAAGRRPVSRLFFNQQAEVMAEKGDRMQVKLYQFKNHPGGVGWVSKSDMLCRNLPIKGKTGLEIKFFIRTDSIARSDVDEEPTVKVFRDPDLKECLGGAGHCREGASRFHMYFVFDEVDNAVLLADRYRLEEGDLLLGWVNKRNGFRWNNAFGVRPREDLKSPGKDGPGTICSYEKLSDAVAKNSEACHPVEGGVKWFTSATRIPVLDLVDRRNRHVTPGEISGGEEARRFYKVALARPGLVGRPVGDGKFAISPQLAQRILPGFQSLSSKKNVDVFFLLDATASMDKVIDAVRGTQDQHGVIQKIINDLRKDQSFKDTRFRFGFRVYRDPFADASVADGPGQGVGEGYALPSTCSVDAEDEQMQLHAFQEAIAKVAVTEDDQDDYEENIYGGLKQVMENDLVSCQDHMKLLFVIGDHGYRSVRLGGQPKYVNPPNRTQLAELLRGSDDPEVKGNNLISFFIQTPARTEDSRNPTAYNRAYNRFEKQAKWLLRESLPPDSPVTEHFFRMGEERLVSRLVGTVRKLGSSALIDEIILDIRGGAALNTVIERLRRERVDIPGVYWHVLKKGACGELGKQCHERVFDTTQVGYIEATPDVVEELWVTSSALASWIRILRGFEGYYELPERQLRRALISALVLGLQQEIRKPPIDVSGETPAEYAQRRGGLPVRRHSPLLSYNVNALSSERTKRNADGTLIVVDRAQKPVLDADGEPVRAVPTCELRRLALWAIKSKEMLEIVERNTVRPVFSASTYPPSRCRDATPNGMVLPRISGRIQRKALGPDKRHRMAHPFGGRRGYWIPKDYLP
ncbi:MAG: hypothetical protein HQL50_01195 [Magnetococcales bacterium]|nr:hypothetical protein [Magnetococcales bacterium]